MKAAKCLLSYRAYDPLDKPIPFGARHRMLSSVDTVETFDPVTYELKIEVVRKEFGADDYSRLRLVENWYWDDHRKRLFMCLESFAPVTRVYDIMGEIRFEKPLFYRHIK